MDVFIAINHPTRKCFLLAHRSQGLILFFHHNATIIQYFHTFTSIIQILKVGSNLFVLTLGELFFFSLTKNLNRTSCLIPWDGIEELQLDESNFKFVYGKRGETIYQFEVGEECRPVGQFHILPKSSFFVASQLIFLQSH